MAAECGGFGAAGAGSGGAGRKDVEVSRRPVLERLPATSRMASILVKAK
jgi:hypothetical protein